MRNWRPYRLTVFATSTRPAKCFDACKNTGCGGKLHRSLYYLSYTETYIGGDRDRSAGRIRVAADGICRRNCSIVEYAVSRGGFDRDVCDITGGVNRRDNRRRALEAALHRHVGVFLVRVDRRPEPICIKWCTARTGDIAVARALSCARTVTDTVTISCTVARASS